MEVKWIKLSTDLFNNRKIRMIESMKDGDAIIVIWLRLLILASEINDSGYVYFTKLVPYTEEMLATQLNRPVEVVALALRTFEAYGMIETTRDYIQVKNWEKYQNTDRLQEIREYNRLAQQKSRAKKKSVNDSQIDESMTSQHREDKNREEKNRLDKINSLTQAALKNAKRNATRTDEDGLEANREVRS